MSSRRRPSTPGIRPSPGEDQSWMSLVAGAAVGGHVRLVVAHVRLGAGSAIPASTPQRLVVQLFRTGVTSRRAPTRPVGATHRAVFPSELRRGVRIALADLEPGADAVSSYVALAWVEPGSPDLDFDPNTARPVATCPVGSATVPVPSGHVRVELRGTDDAAA